MENRKEKNIESLVKENLSKISKEKMDRKNEELLIIKSRFNLIKESNSPKTKKDYSRVSNELLSEYSYLNSQGFDSDMVNEQFLDMIKGFFGTASESFFQTFRESFAKYIVGKLGGDKNGWMSTFLITTIGNIPISDYFSGKIFNCEYLSNVISKSVVETLVEKIRQSAGFDGIIYQYLRNALIEGIEKTDFGMNVEKAIGSLICPKLATIQQKMVNTANTMKDKALSQ